MRARTNPDEAFWSKPADAGTGWMDDLGPEAMDADESRALDDLAHGRHEPTDHVFHELRDMAPPAPVVSAPTVAPLDGDDTDEPDETLPPAASRATGPAPFDIDSVSDDLLPSWSIDLS